MRGYCGSVFVSSSNLCCVDMRTSGSLKKSVDVSVKPEFFVGFESLRGGEGAEMALGLWLRLRESSRIARDLPSLVGGEDCIAQY